ncbi:MAG: DUF4157 domain-containing protein [Scytonematopsis contorta HA4267-MV1]|jgi:TPR repeat protein|nr:DUF4157 domain-containing protein [Scytonematopsis contorta HA4267-MV1]
MGESMLSKKKSVFSTSPDVQTSIFKPRGWSKADTGEHSEQQLTDLQSIRDNYAKRPNFIDNISINSPQQVLPYQEDEVQREEATQEEPEDLETKPLPSIQRTETPQEYENLKTKSSGLVQGTETQEEPKDLQTKPVQNIQRTETLQEDENLQMMSSGQLQGTDSEEEPEEIQTKLTVGDPGDKYEQEAEQTASQVMAMPEPETPQLIQRETGEDEEIQMKPLAKSITPLIQRKSNKSFSASSNLESSLNASKGNGSPLSDDTRGFMEPRFGSDFSPVRVHTDSSAVQMNKDLGAAAFTHGNDIYYGAGKSPGNNELTAHELTHTIQQTGGLRLNKEVRRQADKQEELIAAKQLLISTSSVISNKELRQKPTEELEQVSESLQPKQLTNYPFLQNKNSIQQQPLQVSSVKPRIQGGWFDNPVEQIKGKIADFARQVPGYGLLALILGKDPVSGTPVERNATNLIRGLLSLVPNGENIFNNLEQSGALQRAFNWFNQEFTKLNLSGDAIKGLFAKALQSLGAGDVLNPFGAFEKIKNIFTEPIGRIKNFAVAAGTKVMEFTFEGFLNMAGGAGAKVMEIIRSAGGVLANIVKNPIGFAGNLVAGVKGGFQKFANNMPTHLKNGITGWLFGAMAGAGLALPAQFDLKGVVSLVLQVLGLTYNKFRGKLVQLIGEPRVKRLEQTFEFLKTIVTGGLTAAWQKITEFASNLQEMVIGGIREWVQNSIITAAITKLLSMFNPAGAIVQAVMAIYNTVMFFIERGQQIAALSEAVFASIGNIAAGNVAGAANYVEQAMGRSLPVMISFLARLIGLGGISEQIKNVIKKVQTPIENALNKFANFIVTKTRGLLDNNKEKEKVLSNKDINKILPTSRKEAARQKLENFMLEKDRDISSLTSLFSHMKSEFKLSDVKLEKNGSKGIKIGYYASPAVYTFLDYRNTISDKNKTYYQEINNSKPKFETVVSDVGLPTSRKILKDLFGKKCNLTKSPLNPEGVTADRPHFVKAKKYTPTNDRPGANESLVGALGNNEQMIMEGCNTVKYAGGHLVGWSLLGDEANETYNLAPQQLALNSPAYENTFETPVRNARGDVTIEVKLEYEENTYKIDQGTLRQRNIITDYEEKVPWVIQLPRRVPSRWSAKASFVSGGSFGDGRATNKGGIRRGVSFDNTSNNTSANNPSEYTISKIDASSNKHHFDVEINDNDFSDKLRNFAADATELNFDARQYQSPQPTLSPKPGGTNHPSITQADPTETS